MRLALGGPDAPRAIAGLLKLAREAENENVRLAAWKELLERGFGKAPVDVDIEFRGQLVAGVADFTRLSDAEVQMLAGLAAKSMGLPSLDDPADAIDAETVDVNEGQTSDNDVEQQPAQTRALTKIAGTQLPSALEGNA